LNKDYAILISTTSGAWRYLIGDIIQLINRELSEIIITGRTKHFLSLCGEHLTVDNMNHAIQLMDQELGLGVREYTVTGEKYQSLFAHHWYIGYQEVTESEPVKRTLDKYLKQSISYFDNLLKNKLLHLQYNLMIGIDYRIYRLLKYVVSIK